MLIHTLFDGLAWLSGLLLFLVLRRRPGLATLPLRQHPFYPACITLGGAAGAMVLGTSNLWLSDQPGVGKSILGALAGGIIAVEVYKKINGIHGSTGTVLAPSLALGIAIGRLGCFLSGLDDFTHGTPTSLPWGWDYGDGVSRHPVQLYEAAAMLVCLLWLLPGLARRPAFYQFAAVYAGQRFIWEFLKPYGAVIGPFTVFHVACIGLFLYAWVMLRRWEPGYAGDQAVYVSRPDDVAVRDLQHAGSGQDRP